MIEWFRQLLFGKRITKPAPLSPIEPSQAPVVSQDVNVGKKGKQPLNDTKAAILNGTAPAGLQARTLDLSEIQQTFELPEHLQCFTLDLTKSSIRRIPSGIQVEFRLDLSQCTKLRELPQGLRTGSLVLSQCTRLEALPENLQVNFLNIEGCTALTTWPESATVRMGAVNASGCTSLQALPSTLGPLTNLDLRGCRRITSLPAGLQLSGWVDIADTQIQSLPESLNGVQLRWRGVNINAQIAFFPETLTAEEILAEKNAEVRRVMLERHGLERFISGANAKVLDEDTDPGGKRRLFRVPLPGDEDLVCVSVNCPSTGRHYLIRVPPTTKSCRQAVAWTAGFDNPDDYNPVAET